MSAVYSLTEKIQGLIRAGVRMPANLSRYQPEQYPRLYVNAGSVALDTEWAAEGGPDRGELVSLETWVGDQVEHQKEILAICACGWGEILSDEKSELSACKQSAQPEAKPAPVAQIARETGTLQIRLIIPGSNTVEHPPVAQTEVETAPTAIKLSAVEALAIARETETLEYDEISQSEINVRAWEIAKRMAGGSKGSKKFLSAAMTMVWASIRENSGFRKGKKRGAKAK